MNTDQLLSEVKNEIKRLHKVVSLLEGTSTRRGKRGKRKLSKAARQRIGDAQRKRWAKARAEKKA